MVDPKELKKELKSALKAKDPSRAARVFQLPTIPPGGGVSDPIPYQTDRSFEVEGSDWTQLFVSLVDAFAAAEAGKAAKCYDAQASVHSNMNRLFGSSEGNWLVPALHAVCKSTHRAAIAADKETTAESGRPSSAKLSAAVQLLQDSYSKTFNDRAEYQPNIPFDTQGSKKAGVLTIVNELFSCYFRLNILRLCKNLIRPVETRKLHEVGTMGEKVTYKYYIGRLNMFEDQHDAAEQNLDYALQHCHRNAVHNKRCILKYLIPVKLYRGRLPSPELLEKYQLDEFIPLVQGIRRGDLRTFQDGLVKYQDRFIREGTYLLLEKCKTVCYRNLFKRIHFILDKHQINLAYVARAFKFLGQPMDLDEVECILANLIFRGYVRGYLSHTKRVLVLSKRDPFPTSSVILK